MGIRLPIFGEEVTIFVGFNLTPESQFGYGGPVLETMPNMITNAIYYSGGAAQLAGIGGGGVSQLLIAGTQRRPFVSPLIPPNYDGVFFMSPGASPGLYVSMRVIGSYAFFASVFIEDILIPNVAAGLFGMPYNEKTFYEPIPLASPGSSYRFASEIDNSRVYIRTE